MRGEIDMPSLGAYLRHLRTARKINRATLAAGAGVSESYVTKLEQNRQVPTLAVLDQLGAQVTEVEAEREHLRDLRLYPRLDPNAPMMADIVITESMKAYVDKQVPQVSGWVDRAWGVWYANSEYRRLFRDIEECGNVLTWFFEGPQAKKVMVEWDMEARLTVAWLRALMVRGPEDPAYAKVLSDLSGNREFAQMWQAKELFMARHHPSMRVWDLDHGREVTLTAQVFPQPDPAIPLQLYLGVRDLTPEAGTGAGTPAGEVPQAQGE
jgi:transcriptional regulator with XRE-family HTH domain